MPAESTRSSTAGLPFDSIYRHDFARVVAAIPVVGVGDVEHNAQRTIELAHEAHTDHAAVVVFPELGLVGYSAQDLFHQRAIVDGCLGRLAEVCAATESLRPLLIIGAPMRVGHALFNTAVVLHRGRILGVVPKSYLPNYREFYEKRHFSAARQATATTVELFGQAVPFGTDLLFRADRFSGPRRERRDLRGPVGAGAAEHVRLPRRSHGRREPVGEQHHHREGQLSPRALLESLCTHVLGVRVCRRRLGRIDHRPRVGRSRHHRGERHDRRGEPTLRRRAAARDG